MPISANFLRGLYVELYQAACFYYRIGSVERKSEFIFIIKAVIMLIYPNIDAIAFSIGSLDIYWYGISYVFGLVTAYLVSVQRGKFLDRNWNADQISDLLFYVAVGIVFGGRIGFILIYSPTELLSEPFESLKFWVPGRAFHGGLIGVLLAVYIYGRRNHRKFLAITDFIAPVVPIGIGFGRLGNFINGELWGRVTGLPWGMVFGHVDDLARHPSQLYELFFEGIVLGVWLLLYASKKRHLGAVSGMFALGYGIFRFMLEFVRAPDVSHGFVALNWLTMGQVLSIPMIILGMYLVLLKR